ncbi:MAG TPA: DUF2330 domain-containing protein [Acidimicrobiia bacterium]|jgi:hypothetical protein
MRRLGLLTVLVGAALLLAGAPAGACGGLVGENGTIRLTRTSTLAAYHDGVERYVTSFEFTGEGEEVGSIVPLPGVPTKVERGGDWTLQRLEREVRPPVAFEAASARAGAPTDQAEVLQTAQVDALDITILRGGGEAVGKWAIDHGFLLTPDAPKVLDFYSQRSKIFMAARFDAARARELGQTSGDGTPIMLTIPTPEPWVPLRILALGLDRAQLVDADVFLLTDHRPALRAGDTGLRLERSDTASPALLADLRSDKGMGWVPPAMWLSYLRLDTAAHNVNYDLAVSTHAGVAPSPRMVGIGLAGGPATQPGAAVAPGGGFPGWDVAGVAGGVLVLVAVLAVARRRARAADAS